METRKIASDLRRAEDLQKTELLCLQEKKTQRSKSVFAAHLEEQKQMNYSVVAALKKSVAEGQDLPNSHIHTKASTRWCITQEGTLNLQELVQYIGHNCGRGHSCKIP